VIGIYRTIAGLHYMATKAQGRNYYYIDLTPTYKAAPGLIIPQRTWGTGTGSYTYTGAAVLMYPRS
jgi:hypothetical protein